MHSRGDNDIHLQGDIRGTFNKFPASYEMTDQFIGFDVKGTAAAAIYTLFLVQAFKIIDS